MATGPTGLLGAQRAVFRSSLTALEKLVMLAALDHWGASSQRPWPSIAKLAQWSTLSRSAVIRAVQGLETKGAIKVQRTHGRPNVYTLTAAFAGGLPVCVSDQSASATSLSEPPPPVCGGDHHQSAGETTTSLSARPEGTH